MDLELEPLRKQRLQHLPELFSAPNPIALGFGENVVKHVVPGNRTREGYLIILQVVRPHDEAVDRLGLRGKPGAGGGNTVTCHRSAMHLNRRHLKCLEWLRRLAEYPERHQDDHTRAADPASHGCAPQWTLSVPVRGPG